MRKHRKVGLLAVVCGLLFATLLGVTNVALAEDALSGNIYGDGNDVFLTKVISVKDGIKVVSSDPSAKDSYTFHFAGAGAVTESNGKLVSGDASEQVEQDGTLSVGTTVPALGTDGNVTIEAVDIPTGSAGADYQTSNGSGTYVGAVHKSLKDILTASGVSFQNPGIYTYRVTETAVDKAASGAGTAVIQSRASYLMKVKVLWDGTQGKPVPTDIVVLKEKDDEGNPDGNVFINRSRKVDPSFPKLVGSTAQINTSAGGAPEGVNLGSDDRGHDVFGFTFTNEYVTGMAFSVKKEVSGNMADRNKTFPITITLTDQAAPEGCRYVYAAFDKNGSEIANSRSAATFNDEHKATIQVQISDGQYIKVIGLQGTLIAGRSDPENDQQANYSSSNQARTWLNDGLVPSTSYSVKEAATKNYQGTIYTFNSDDVTQISNATTGETKTTVATGIASQEVGTGTLTTDGAAKTVLVVNAYDETNTSFTGIFFNNLPYILMVAVPAGVIAIVVVGRLRSDGEDA